MRPKYAVSTVHVNPTARPVREDLVSCLLFYDEESARGTIAELSKDNEIAETYLWELKERSVKRYYIEREVV